MSRQGSIFYDAPEALGALPINDDKDDMEKVVKIFFVKIVQFECFLFFSV
jgi:hypothetical protein